MKVIILLYIKIKVFFKIPEFLYNSTAVEVQKKKDHYINY